MSADKKIQVGILSVGILIITLAILMPSTAQAGEKTYIGYSYDMIDIDGVADFTGHNIKFGKQFNELFGAEVRALISSGTEGVSGVDVEIDSLYGVYLTLGLPLSDDLYLYGVVGHTEGELTGSYGGYSESASDDGTSFGFGLKKELLEAYVIRAEYTQLLNEVDVLGFGIDVRF